MKVWDFQLNKQEWSTLLSENKKDDTCLHDSQGYVIPHKVLMHLGGIRLVHAWLGESISLLLHCSYSQDEKPSKCPLFQKTVMSDQESDRHINFPRTGSFCGLICHRRKSDHQHCRIPAESACDELMLLPWRAEGPLRGTGLAGEDDPVHSASSPAHAPLLFLSVLVSY